MTRRAAFLAVLAAVSLPATGWAQVSFGDRLLPQITVPAPQQKGPGIGQIIQQTGPLVGGNFNSGVVPQTGTGNIGAIIQAPSDPTGAVVSDPPAAPEAVFEPAPVVVALESVEDGAVALQVVSVPPSARIEVVTPTGKAAASDAGQVLLELAASHVPDVILAGGYLSSFVPPEPLGLTKVDGEIISRAHESWLTSALFCVGENGPEILPYAAEAPARFEDCLQAGPMIVADGASRYPTDDLEAGEAKLAARVVIHSFVCIDGDGHLVMGMSSEASLDELGPALVDGVGCRNAMRLTGSDTAGLYLRGTGLLGENRYGLPNAIAVFDVSVESDLTR